MRQYLEYLFTHIIKDIEVFNHWWMLFIFPAVIWAIIVLLKYALLTLPIWLPIKLIIKGFTVEVTKKEDKDECI